MRGRAGAYGGAALGSIRFPLSKDGAKRAGRGLMIAALAGLMPLPALAAADPILSQLAGNWIGRGTFKQSPDAKPEPVYCKIANTLASGGAVLTQKGRCAVSSNSGSISGTIQANGSGSYQGSLQSLTSKGPATLSGKAAKGGINFSASFIDRKTQKPSKASVTLVVADGKYRLVSNRVNPADNAEFAASDIVFTPQ